MKTGAENDPHYEIGGIEFIMLRFMVEGDYIGYIRLWNGFWTLKLAGAL